jgi:HlyD family secretion protein
LRGVNKLWLKNLVPYASVTRLEREKERPERERGQLVASIAQSKGKITEIEIQILQIDQDMRTEVGKDLDDIRGKIAELVETKVAAEDQLKRRYSGAAVGLCSPALRAYGRGRRRSW